MNDNKHETNLNPTDIKRVGSESVAALSPSEPKRTLSPPAKDADEEDVDAKSQDLPDD